MSEISNILRSVRKPYFRANYHVYKIGCLLVRGISLSVAQLFLIVIESILRGVCGQFNKIKKSDFQQLYCTVLIFKYNPIMGFAKKKQYTYLYQEYNQIHLLQVCLFVRHTQ